MGAQLTRTASWRARGLGLPLATVIGVVGCGAALPAARTAPAARGGTVTWAQPAGATPNYIFPMLPGADYSIQNLYDLNPLMYRPLYWYDRGGQIAYNSKLSLADPPVFSASGGRTVVTIRLKPARWSDGRPVTTRDVRFWLDLLIANAANWGAFVPGEFPSDLVAERYSSPTTFSLTFNRVYNHYWILDSQLFGLYPIPQHAWDRTSLHGSVGNYDETHSGAQAVYRFLNTQSTSLATWATNPLWRVVDGPWRLAQFDATTGYTAFIPNPRYSGPVKPSFSRFVELPFTSDTAEFNALRAGAVDYGYIPIQDVSQTAFIRSHGYRIAPWITWTIGYAPVNFTNVTVAPVLSQLYVRQAMQHLVDQPAYIRDIFKGLATPTYGPVPAGLPSPFLSAGDRHNAYPYDPAAAVRLLRSHGWTVRPDGSSTCAHPGVGAGRCGAGIAGGTPLSFSMLYDSGYLALAQMMQALKSSFSRAGITLSLTTAPFNTVIATVDPCDKQTGVGCHWDIGDWQDPIGWSYDPYPSGDELFMPGAFDNSGNYSNQVTTADVLATDRRPGLQPMYGYENYLATQAPVLWLPDPDYQVSAIRTSLSGVLPQAPNLYITPENWRHT